MGSLNNHYTDEEKRLKKSYYSLVNQTLKKRYYQNKTDLFNQGYSLFIKDFKKSYINLRITITENARNFIPWKLYLLRRIHQLAETQAYIWAQNLFDYISNVSFPDQNKFQNLFFYQEFDIITKIKINNSDNIKKNLNPLSLKSDIQEEIYGGEMYGTNTMLEKAKNLIKSNLMGSFASLKSDSTNSLLMKDPNYEYQINKTKIKEYIEIFKDHISRKEHPINLIIYNFVKEFLPFLNEVIEFYNNNNLQNEKACKDKALDIITQLQEFMVIIQVTIKLFYSRCISYKYFKDEKDEFLNLVSYIIFNDEKIYKQFFELLQYMNTNKITILENKFNDFGDLNPEDIGVKDKFCLNEITKKFMEKYKIDKKLNIKNNTNNKKEEIKKNENLNSNNENLINENQENQIITNINTNKENIINTNVDFDENENKEKNDNNKNMVELTHISKKNDNNENDINNLIINNETNKSQHSKNYLILNEENNLNDVPFGEAVAFLKTISEFRIPLEKLVVIASVSSLITDCVNKYWKCMENYITPSLLTINADELMTIFLYIVYKCHMPMLFVHADFIKYFTSPTTKATMIGYYFTTLEGCLNYLLEIKDKKDFIKD